MEPVEPAVAAASVAPWHIDGAGSKAGSSNQRLVSKGTLGEAVVGKQTVDIPALVESLYLDYTTSPVEHTLSCSMTAAASSPLCHEDAMIML